MNNQEGQFLSWAEIAANLNQGDPAEDPKRGVKVRLTTRRTMALVALVGVATAALRYAVWIRLRYVAYAARFRDYESWANA
jgi:hypothetical protein